MATIQSATGPLDTSDLGFTLTHEHVSVGSPAVRQQFPDRYDRDAVLETAAGNLTAAREAGVRTVVDLTPLNLGRDAALIREASELSGVQIIVATGIYYPPDVGLAFVPTDEIAELFIREIESGIQDTGIRAGVIKCATEPEMTAFNRRSVRAAERGYANRVCLSHDAGVIDGLSEADKAAQIPDWRFTFIPQEFSLMLRERGVSDEAIEQMTVGNPRAIFEQTEPY